jgi:polynucleotide 5'-kinase involved in rRNA processing
VAIETSLSRSLTVINQYHGAFTATTTGTILRKLTAAVASIPEKSDTSEQAPVRQFIVPIIWSDDFSGRQEIMTQLEKALSESDKHCRVAIVGLGGVGKTRVMMEYAYR